MRTAKELFRASPAFANFQKLLADPAFEPACHAALAALVESLPPSAADPSKAWDAYLQILGARRVLDIFSRLHEPDEPARKEAWPSLNYDNPRPRKG
jgi:hypothetical protein